MSVVSNGVNQRADARRNRGEILRSALELFKGDASAPMSAIASAAGVGRVTLYGHFACRELLVEAAFVEAMDQSARLLGTLDLSGDVPEVLNRVIDTSWRRLIDNHTMLLAAEKALGADRAGAHHDAVRERVRGLILRGQDAGLFRTDLGTDWLMACFYATLHAASAEVAARRLEESAAPATIRATLVAALARDNERRDIA